MICKAAAGRQLSFPPVFGSCGNGTLLQVAGTIILQLLAEILEHLTETSANTLLSVYQLYYCWTSGVDAGVC